MTVFIITKKNDVTPPRHVASTLTLALDWIQKNCNSYNEDQFLITIMDVDGDTPPYNVVPNDDF